MAFEQALNRIEPNGPAAAYRTFQIAAPSVTHFRPASCAEVDCRHWREGWATVLPIGDERAEYVRATSGRRFVETRDATHVTFTFTAGQRCFRAADHRVRLDRRELYIVRDGDWRGNPRGTDPVRLSSDDWVGEFAANQDRIITAQKRG